MTDINLVRTHLEADRAELLDELAEFPDEESNGWEFTSHKIDIVELLLRLLDRPEVASEVADAYDDHVSRQLMLRHRLGKCPCQNAHYKPEDNEPTTGGPS